MSFKKLKTTTGIIGLVGIVLAVVCYFVSFVIAGQYEGEELIGVAISFVAFIFPLGAVVLTELVLTIIFLADKFNTRTFFIVDAALSFLDLFICFVLVYCTIFITMATNNVFVPLINTISVLILIAFIVLKIICAVKFKNEN